MSGIPSAVVNFISAFKRLNMKEPVEVRLANYDQLYRLQLELREYVLDGAVWVSPMSEVTIYGVKFTAPCPTCGCTHKKYCT